MRRAARHRERGQALTEFVLLVPALFLLFVVAVDFGRLFTTYVGMTNAAREAAVYGSAAPSCLSSGSGAGCSDPDNMTFRARQELSGDAELVVTRSCAPSCSSASGIGSQLTVRVTRPFSFVTPMLTQVMGGPLTLSASATSVIL